jgi:uncharacterized membrane protein YecN with MAPEG domain
VKTLEDWKIKIAVLWLVFECGAILTPLFELYEPGFIEGLIAGEAAGMQITSEVTLVLAIILVIPPIMAFLSLILKDSINRWANIILGIVFVVLASYGLSSYLAQLDAWAIIIWVSQVVANALIVWYAWKSK